MKKKINSVLIVSLILFLQACDNKPVRNEGKESLEALADSQGLPEINTEKEFKYMAIIANIPAPSHEVVEISKAGYGYDEDLCNDTDNSEKYNTTFKMTLNYGVFLSDLSYVASYAQKEDVIRHYEATKKLSVGAGVLNTFDKVSTEALFLEHITEPEVMEQIIDKIYISTDEYLASDHHLDVAVQILLGSWIENQYLVLSNIKDGKRTIKNNMVWEQVWEQKLHLANINNLMKEYGHNEELLLLSRYLSDFYDEFYVPLKESKELNTEKINAMYKQMKEIRNEIVSLD